MAESIDTAGWIVAQTEYGDTLARIALRELGDASRWPELAWLNKLSPPYLTSMEVHPGLATGRVILMGGNIRIPARSGQRQEISPTESFGVDVLLTNGRLTVQGGDLSLASGRPNLRQALELRLRHDLGSLPFHPRYGNEANHLRGHKLDTGILLLALRFCEECLLGDPRVLSVQDGVAEAVGDAIRVEITAVADDGSPLRLQVEI